jgi:hypothetical protein
MDFEVAPSLTEPGVKYFLRETLKQCHDKRTNYYNIVWNCGFFLLLLVLVGVILSYRKRNKLTPEQKKEKQERDHAHVMSKIKALREERKKINNEIITNLPKFESDYEMLHKNYYAV